MFTSVLRAAASAAALLAASAAPAAPGAGRGDRSAAIRARIADPEGGIIVVAHRGCHNPAPRHGRGSTPENSLAALEQCVAIGVDVMETDVRRTRDGALVMIHDDSVDRTTNGEGRVSDLSLAELRALFLRDNEGGKDAGITDQKVVTLEEMLARARGRILLNLDVKDGTFGEVAAAVKRAGMSDQVIVKAYAGAASAPLADMPPYDLAPFIAMLSSGDRSGKALPAILRQQSAAAHRPIAYEIPRMPAAALPALAAAARSAGARLWANSLWEGYVASFGGDVDALRDPDGTWGRLYRGGISMIQTDEPEALLAYVAREGTNR